MKLRQRRAAPLAGPNADKVIAIIAEKLKVPPALLRQITPNDVNPDGRVNVASLQRDYDMYRTWGYVPKPVSVPSLANMHDVDDAGQVLGKAQAERDTDVFLALSNGGHIETKS